MVDPRMYGYVIQGAKTGNVKVGISENIQRRLGQHRGSCSERLIVRLQFQFGSEQEAREWEQRALLEFAELRIGRSEWLNASPHLNAAIDSGIVGGEASTDLLKFSRALYRKVFPETQGRPFIFKDRRNRHGWCCVVFHPTAPLAWLHWDFYSWQEAFEAVPELQYGAPRTLVQEEW